jgi:hypothetical protein
MAGKRIYFQTPIAELEKLIEEERHHRATLRKVLAELKHRDTDRAGRLRHRITAILDGLELDFSPPGNPLAPDLLGFAPTANEEGHTGVQDRPGHTEARSLLSEVRQQGRGGEPANEAEVIQSEAHPSDRPVAKLISRPADDNQAPSLAAPG